MTTTRRLAAILAADVAGYSRLMGADEEGTHERLKAHRRELVDPKISEHSGRIVKTTGDGILVEFPSVVDAVRCAAELQRAMIDREAAMPEDRRIRFRVGINLGDVIVDGDDIFGDGVNVAARLEALSDPGGLARSGQQPQPRRGRCGARCQGSAAWPDGNSMGRRECSAVSRFRRSQFHHRRGAASRRRCTGAGRLINRSLAARGRSSGVPIR
jgi:hypothetical protein